MKNLQNAPICYYLFLLFSYLLISPKWWEQAWAIYLWSIMCADTKDGFLLTFSEPSVEQFEILYLAINIFQGEKNPKYSNMLPSIFLLSSSKINIAAEHSTPQTSSVLSHVKWNQMSGQYTVHSFPPFSVTAINMHVDNKKLWQPSNLQMAYDIWL